VGAIPRGARWFAHKNGWPRPKKLGARAASSAPCRSSWPMEEEDMGRQSRRAGIGRRQSGTGTGGVEWRSGKDSLLASRHGWLSQSAGRGAVDTGKPGGEWSDRPVRQRGLSRHGCQDGLVRTGFSPRHGEPARSANGRA
jgi:hypothetical protein